MAEKKQALLIFTKPPLPGVVKTRMTNEYGGFFSMEQAAQFYKCCFYDVCEMSKQALDELQAMNDELVAADPTADKVTYDFFVSTTPAKSLPKVKEVMEVISSNWGIDVNYVVDTGSTFDEHFNDAFSQIFAMGYESIVSIGGDVPTMPKSHLIQAFQWLDYFQNVIGKPGFVCAPCQECGTSLVGFSHNTIMDHTGVYYNMEGRPALDGYLMKLQEADVPSAYFEPVADVDEITDLGHAISCMRAIKEAAKYQPLFVPTRTLAWCELMGITVSTPPNDNHDPRDILDGDEDVEIDEAEFEKFVSTEAGDAPTEGELKRIAEGMASLRTTQAAENAYEASQYE